MSATALGVALRFLRERQGLSCIELGDLVNQDHYHIHMIETGEKWPSMGVAMLVANELKPDRRESLIVRWCFDFPMTSPGIARRSLECGKDDVIVSFIRRALEALAHDWKKGMNIE